MVHMYGVLHFNLQIKHYCFIYSLIDCSQNPVSFLQRYRVSNGNIYKLYDTIEYNLQISSIVDKNLHHFYAQQYWDRESLNKCESTRIKTITHDTHNFCDLTTCLRLRIWTRFYFKRDYNARWVTRAISTLTL